MKLRVCFVMLVVALGAVASAQVTGSHTGAFVVGWAGSSNSAPLTPYTADVVNITDRVLADGNRIHQETRGKTMRDSQGRTREEIALPYASEEGISYIVINDPVQQEIITLDTRSKTAQVRNLQALTTGKGTISSGAGTVGIVRGGALTVGVAGHSTAVQPQNSSEQLGTREIDGFTTTGTRFTFTIPAGAMGNERPLVSTNESWCSNELGTVLLSIHDDPQSGKTVRRLENIQRGEPDITLFEVPPDYTVSETQ